MCELGKACNERGYHPKVIPKGMEDYLGFMLFRHQRCQKNGDEGPATKQARTSYVDDAAEETVVAAPRRQRARRTPQDVPEGFVGERGPVRESKREPVRIGDKRKQSIPEGEEEVYEDEGLIDLIGGDETVEGEWNSTTKRYSIRFLDSCQYLAASLEKLIGGLDKGKDFLHMRQHFAPNVIDMLLRKGIYPYEYMDSFNRFEERGLPPQRCFYSSLNDENISDEDYTHAHKVYDALNINNMGEWHDLYLTCDVLGLADVMENFREACMKDDGLDPLHYFTLPGYSWDAMLKMTKVEIQLMKDQEMYKFAEDAVRGGVSQISKRRAKANNPDANCKTAPYNPSKPKSWIIYKDANNLYGWAMFESLPKGGFRWLTDEEVTCFKPRSQETNGNTGYFVEVDIAYPEHLHDLHNDLPLAPEKLSITEEMLSPYAKAVKHAHNVDQGRRETERLWRSSSQHS